MKLIQRFSALVLCIAAVMPASAQFSIGPRVGINVNSLHMSDKIFDSDNRLGMNAGLQAEFMIPMLGFGFDASVMYVHRSSKAFASDNAADYKVSSDYIEIPVNLKYKFSLPVVGKIIAPYVFTGPSFAFRTSKSAINEFVRSKKSDIAWNFGIGLQLIKHLQIGASYGLGLSKAYDLTETYYEIYPDGMTTVTPGKTDVKGKNRFWTVTAAWLF